MLHLFRRIRERLLDSGQVKNYSIYAVGEIALVVIGILIAIQIDNWNQDKIESNEEKEILNELKISLQNDLVLIQEKLEFVKKIENKIQVLQVLLTQNESVMLTDSLFGAVYGMQRFDVNTASYEELKSHGINLLSNDEIRRLTIRIFDTHLKAIQHMNKVEDNVVLEALRPYYLENFTQIRFSETASPKNLEELLKDDFFHNLVDYRLTVLRTLHLKTYPEIIKDMEDLLRRIHDFVNG
jgi:hypothetical protein